MPERRTLPSEGIAWILTAYDLQVCRQLQESQLNAGFFYTQKEILIHTYNRNFALNFQYTRVY